MPTHRGLKEMEISVAESVVMFGDGLFCDRKKLRFFGRQSRLTAS
jgi:predicted HAD superfamily phosphohydrolase YqeG